MNQPRSESDQNASGRVGEGRLGAWLVHPRFVVRIAVLAALWVAPSLLIGFHLDDHVHRYLFSGLPGSDALWRAYQSPFGIANGEPSVNRWQIEHGYAPWWTDPDLLISLYRPLSELTHRVDAWLWPDAAWIQHLHSCAWYAALVVAATLLYRGIAGAGTVGALAALLYAVDHTHGFAAGWIANRNALVSACLGVLALWAHDRGRAGASMRHSVAAPVLLLGALFAGEGAVAIVGYLVAYALFLDRAALPRRIASLVPAGAVVAGWRVAYAIEGRGAHGSGLYLDPAHEPLKFLAAAIERVPILFLGEIGLPPAELYTLGSPTWVHGMWLFAVLASLAFVVAAAPLLRVDRTARFWALGAAVALVPACTTHPNNRLLFFVGLGVLGLLSQLWHAAVEGRVWAPGSGPLRPLARGVIGTVTGFHLFVSPALLPLAACSVALSASVERSARSLLDAPDASKHDLVLVSAPDYFYVKLVPVLAALEHRAPPRRLRALSFGAVPVTATRTDARTLELDYAGGILAHPLLELYRARDLPMPVGTRVALDGLAIEVLATTGDGRPRRVRFAFDVPLEDRSLRWMVWKGNGYAPFALPRVGQRKRIAPAFIPLGP